MNISGLGSPAMQPSVLNQAMEQKADDTPVADEALVAQDTQVVNQANAEQTLVAQTKVEEQSAQANEAPAVLQEAPLEALSAVQEKV